MEEDRHRMPSDVRNRITIKADELEDVAKQYLAKYKNSRSRVAASRDLQPIFKMMGELGRLFYSPQCTHKYKDLEIMATEGLHEGRPLFIEFRVNEDGSLIKVINKKMGYPIPILQPISRTKTSAEEVFKEYGISPQDMAEVIQHNAYHLFVSGVATQPGADA
jgi:hypothetical protein